MCDPLRLGPILHVQCKRVRFGPPLFQVRAQKSCVSSASATVWARLH